MRIRVSAQTTVSFPTGSSRIAVGLKLLAVYGLFADICNQIIVGLQCFTKRGKHMATIDSPARMVFCPLERFNHDHAARENYVQQGTA
jgi:hypothetical protein